MNKEQLAKQINEIQIKSNHLKRMRTWLISSALIGLICVIVAWWGFGNIQDSILPNLSMSIRSPLAWIASIIGFFAIIFMIFVFIGIRNGKKHVLGLIDDLEKRKK